MEKKKKKDRELAAFVCTFPNGPEHRKNERGQKKRMQFARTPQDLKIVEQETMLLSCLHGMILKIASPLISLSFFLLRLWNTKKEQGQQLNLYVPTSTRGLGPAEELDGKRSPSAPKSA